MSAPEVPSALDRGVVDGIFTAGVGAVLWKDLLKYGYVLIINVNNSYFIANTEAFNKLSPDLQAKLRKVAEDSARWDQETMQEGGSGLRQSPNRCGIYLHQRDAGGECARGRGDEAILGRMGEVARSRRSSRRWQRCARRSDANSPQSSWRRSSRSRAHGSPPRAALKEGIVERICKFACVAALVVMLVVVGVDILTRSLFNFSFEMSDELGGYMLVVITFLSLPVCQVNDSFHHVEFVQSRLSPCGRAMSHVIFDLLSLAFCVLLLWQFVGSRSPRGDSTIRPRPIWQRRSGYRRLVMLLGAVALCFSVLRALVGQRCRACALLRR